MFSETIACCSGQNCDVKSAADEYIVFDLTSVSSKIANSGVEWYRFMHQGCAHTTPFLHTLIHTSHSPSFMFTAMIEI